MQSTMRTWEGAVGFPEFVCVKLNSAVAVFTTASDISWSGFAHLPTAYRKPLDLSSAARSRHAPSTTGSDVQSPSAKKLSSVPCALASWRLRVVECARWSASLLILLRFFPQSRCRAGFRFRFRTGDGLMHRIRAKDNTAGPFHAAAIGIHGDGVEGTGVQQLQKHAAAPLRFNGENPAHTVVERDFQPALRKRFSASDLVWWGHNTRTAPTI